MTPARHSASPRPARLLYHHHQATPINVWLHLRKTNNLPPLALSLSPGYLLDLAGGQRPHALPVEFLQLGEYDAGDVQVETHADRVRCKQDVLVFVSVPFVCGLRQVALAAVASAIEYPGLLPAQGGGQATVDDATLEVRCALD